MYVRRIFDKISISGMATLSPSLLALWRKIPMPILLAEPSSPKAIHSRFADAASGSGVVMDAAFPGEKRW